MATQHVIKLTLDELVEVRQVLVARKAAVEGVLKALQGRPFTADDPPVARKDVEHEHALLESALRSL